MSIEDGYHDERPEDIQFTPKGGEPIDLSKYVPKYSDSLAEESKRMKEKLEGLRSAGFTFEGAFDEMFKAEVERHFAHPPTPYQRRQREYANRMASLKGLEHMLIRFGYLFQASVWNGLPYDTKVAFLLYYANRRACMN